MMRTLRDHTAALAIALFLLSTQFTMMVPNPVSLSGAKALRLTELIGIAIIAWLLILLVRDRGFARISRLSRAMLGLTVLAGIAWGVMVLVRRAILGHLTVSISMIEYLAIAVATHVLLERLCVSASQVLRGALLFLLGTNLYAGAKVLFGATIRNQHLLGNINYYVGLALVCLPPVAFQAMRTRSRLMAGLCWLAVGSTLAIVFLSGSRFGGVVIVLCSFLIFSVVDPRPMRRRPVSLAAVLLCAVLTFGGLVLTNREQLRDVGRTFNIGSVVTGEEPDTEQIKAEQADKPKSEPVLSEQDVATTPGDPDHDAPPPPPQLNILNHSRVDSRSRAVLADHWLLGTGRIGPYFSGYGYQPAHNIVIESLLYWGAVGVLPFVALMGLVWVGGWRRGDRNSFLLGFCGLLGFSLFQPLLSDGLVTILPLWILLRAARARREPGRIGVSVAKAGAR